MVCTVLNLYRQYLINHYYCDQILVKYNKADSTLILWLFNKNVFISLYNSGILCVFLEFCWFDSIFWYLKKSFNLKIKYLNTYVRSKIIDLANNILKLNTWNVLFFDKFLIIYEIESILIFLENYCPNLHKYKISSPFSNALK